MTKKTIIASTCIATLSLGAIAFTFARAQSFNSALGNDAEYQITLDNTNAPQANEYSKVVKTAQGNDFTVSYTGSHSLNSSYHTVLGNGASIWNNAKPISHLQSITVDIDGGSLVVKGGQTSNNLYESYTLSDDGVVNFTDDVNYFKVEATSQTKVVKLVLRYTDDCATGATESAKTISLEGVPTTLEVGKNSVITPSTNSKGTIEVVSTDPTVASITKTTGKSGTTYKVNALKEGTCKIYATTSNGLKSDEATLKVISVGLPANTVGKTYRATSENEFFKYGYVTINSATTLTYKYETFTTTGTFDETVDNQRIFYMDDGVSYLKITPSSNGESLDVFGEIYDDSNELLNRYGNIYTRTGTDFNKYVKATSLALNKTSTTLEVNGQETLTATVSSGATDPELEWKSSNPTIVSVEDANSKTRTIKALAAGTATITVKDLDSGLTATCTVTVNAPIAVTDFTITGSNKVKVGQTTTLTVNVTPSGAKYSSLVWASDNASIASVNSKGVVTGVKAGTTNIKATIDGTITKTFAITVEADSDAIPAYLQGEHWDAYDSGILVTVGPDSITITFDEEGYEETFDLVSRDGDTFYFENDIVMELATSFIEISGFMGIDEIYYYIFEDTWPFYY